MIQSRQTEVANLDLSCGGDEDVGRLEVAVDDPVVVQVRDAVEELPKEGLENCWGKSRAGRRVVMNDLLCEASATETGRVKGRTHQEVVLCVLEHEVNALVLEHDLSQGSNVLVRYLPVDLRTLSCPP